MKGPMRSRFYSKTQVFDENIDVGVKPGRLGMPSQENLENIIYVKFYKEGLTQKLISYYLI